MLERLRWLAISLGIALVGRNVVEAGDFGGRFDDILAHASPRQAYAFLYAMPKGGDLHNHAGGANRPEWIYKVCTDPSRTGGETFYTRARIHAPLDVVDPSQVFRTIRRRTYEALSLEQRAEFVALESLTPAERTRWYEALRIASPEGGRFEFFSHIWPRIQEVGQCLPVVTELLIENMKAFGGEQVAYVETQFMVDGMRDNEGRPIPENDAVAFVRNRLAQPDALATGVTVRFQRTILRFRPDAEARLAQAYAFVDAHRDLWVGLNMAGIEEEGHGYPLRFLATFRALRSRYPTLPLSIHAGEMDGPDNHIRDTLLLGASRIGHGVNLIKDPETLLLLQQTRRVLVEINLISNRLLGYVPDLSQHPFPEYLRTGIPVCLNTDDRGMWDSNLTDEYYTAVTLFHLSWDEILAMGRDSITHSFAPAEVRSALLTRYNARIAEFEARFSKGEVDASISELMAVKPEAYGYAERTWGIVFQ